MSVGTQTLLPGASTPSHRHLHHDEVVFVHKGQGRAMLEARSVTVVPGVMLVVPRGAWHSLRNTGTGALQVTWTVAPPGLEEFFREFAKLGASPEPAALRALAERFGMEIRAEAAQAPTAPAGHRRRRRHGDRGRGRANAQAQPLTTPASPSPQPPAVSTPQPPIAAAAARPQTSDGGRKRRRRRGRRGGRGRQPQAGSVQPQPQRGSAPPPAGMSQLQARPPQTPARKPEPRRRREQGGGRHRRDRVKEVYMGGRWVQVRGEGPVIASGEDAPRRRKSARGDEGPAGPLSVPL